MDFFHMGACPLASLGTDSLPCPFPNTTFTSLTIASTSSPVRLWGFFRWSGLPLKCFPFFLTWWFKGRNRRWPRYTTFRHLFKYILSRSSKQCVHALYPLFVWPEDYLKQANHWLLRITLLIGQSVLVCTHPKHVHLICSIKLEVFQLMASDRHQCCCQVASDLGWGLAS